MDMREWLIGFHLVLSSLFLLLGFYILGKSLSGRLRNLDFTRRDDFFSRLYVWFLYLQFFLGLTLYFVYHFMVDTPLSADEKAAGSRFWVISHFSVMIFTLILAQIGRIFINSARDARRKFGYTLFYYGISLIFTIFSAVLSVSR